MSYTPTVYTIVEVCRDDERGLAIQRDSDGQFLSDIIMDFIFFARADAPPHSNRPMVFPLGKRKRAERYKQTLDFYEQEKRKADHANRPWHLCEEDGNG